MTGELSMKCKRCDCELEIFGSQYDMFIKCTGCGSIPTDMRNKGNKGGQMRVDVKTPVTDTDPVRTGGKGDGRSSRRKHAGLNIRDLCDTGIKATDADDCGDAREAFVDIKQQYEDRFEHFDRED